MTSFNEKLARYAELAVKVGVNIQPGQQLYIAAAIDAAPLVRLITQKAYETGAKQVYVDWNDDAVSRLRFELAPEDSFSDYPAWKVQEREQLAEQGAAFISVVSQSPDLLSGIDSKRIAASQKATGQALSKYRQYVQSDKISWTVIAAPLRNGQLKSFQMYRQTNRSKLYGMLFLKQFVQILISRLRHGPSMTVCFTRKSIT